MHGLCLYAWTPPFRHWHHSTAAVHHRFISLASGPDIFALRKQARGILWVEVKTLESSVEAPSLVEVCWCGRGRLCVCVCWGGAVREEGGESEEEQPDVNRKQKRERKKEEPLVFHYCRQKLNLPLVA